MFGKITFRTAESLAEFLAKFAGKTTALFEVEELMDGTFELTFNGGY